MTPEWHRTLPVPLSIDTGACLSGTGNPSIGTGAAPGKRRPTPAKRLPVPLPERARAYASRARVYRSRVPGTWNTLYLYYACVVSVRVLDPEENRRPPPCVRDGWIGRK